MVFRYMKDGAVLEDSDQPSQAGAVRRGEELSALYGSKIEVWTPAFVVVPVSSYKCVDYSKSKEL